LKGPEYLISYLEHHCKNFVEIFDIIDESDDPIIEINSMFNSKSPQKLAVYAIWRSILDELKEKLVEIYSDWLSPAHHFENLSIPQEIKDEILIDDTLSTRFLEIYLGTCDSETYIYKFIEEIIVKKKELVVELFIINTGQKPNPFPLIPLIFKHIDLFEEFIKSNFHSIDDIPISQAYQRFSSPKLIDFIVSLAPLDISNYNINRIRDIVGLDNLIVWLKHHPADSKLIRLYERYCPDFPIQWISEIEESQKKNTEKLKQLGIDLDS
jgi:hypothetical protein